MGISIFREKFMKELNVWREYPSAIASKVEPVTGYIKKIFEREVPLLEDQYTQITQVKGLLDHVFIKGSDHERQLLRPLLDMLADREQEISGVLSKNFPPPSFPQTDLSVLRLSQDIPVEKKITSFLLAMNACNKIPSLFHLRMGNISSFDRASIRDFFSKKYSLSIDGMNDAQLIQCLEAFEKESAHADVSQKRAEELFRRAKSGCYLFSKEIPKQVRVGNFPSTAQLVARYQSLPYVRGQELRVFAGEDVVSGYYNEEDEEKELVRLLSFHNELYAKNSQQVQSNAAGHIEKLEVNAADTLCVRADLHGDLPSLLEYLKTLQRGGLLDSSFHCMPGTQLIFLGDYTDRSLNDFEVLRVLTQLRLENPGKVHLIRGNHEDIRTQMAYSRVAEQFQRNEEIYTQFYETLPLAIVSRVGRDGEVVHFSHGAMNPAVDCKILLDADASCMTIPRYPSMSEQIYENADDPASRRKHEAFMRLAQSRTSLDMNGWFNYMWADVGGDIPKAASFIKSNPEIGRCTFSEQNVQDWAEYQDIAAAFRGHLHAFMQTCTKDGKVLCTTLPAGYGTEMYPKTLAPQGFILRVASMAKEWTKQAIIPSCEEKDLPMYQIHPAQLSLSAPISV